MQIASGNHAEAIQYGRKILAPVANSSDDKKSKLEVTLFSLQILYASSTI